MSKSIKIALALLALELVREVFVLNALGFEPGRFVQWVRGEDIA